MYFYCVCFIDFFQWNSSQPAVTATCCFLQVLDMFSWTFNKRRPPDNFSYSQNLKIVWKPIEYLQLRKWRGWIPVLSPKTWCFLGVASWVFFGLLSHLCCVCVVFLQDCLKLPGPPLACIPSCTMHPYLFSICGFWPIIPSVHVCLQSKSLHSSWLSTVHVFFFLPSALS